ncbi:hypothetical protein L9F63_018572, partial [Diploptera punctata]
FSGCRAVVDAKHSLWQNVGELQASRPRPYSPKMFKIIIATPAVKVSVNTNLLSGNPNIQLESISKYYSTRGRKERIDRCKVGFTNLP